MSVSTSINILFSRPTRGCLAVSCQLVKLCVSFAAGNCATKTKHRYLTLVQREVMMDAYNEHRFVSELYNNYAKVDAKYKHLYWYLPYVWQDVATKAADLKGDLAAVEVAESGRRPSGAAS